MGRKCNRIAPSAAQSNEIINVYTIHNPNVDDTSHNNVDSVAECCVVTDNIITLSNNSSVVMMHTSTDKSQTFWFLCVDLPIFLLVLVATLLVEFGLIPSVKSGFHCNDPNISLPYKGDTVSFLTIVGTVIIIPPIVLWLCECYLFRSCDHSAKTSRCKVSVRLTLNWFKEHMFGVSLQLALVEGLKVVFGEPRPHFISTCKPDVWDKCKGTEYITSYKCTNVNVSVWGLVDASRSFPSGHSSLAIHTAIFIILYLQSRMKSSMRKSALLLPMIQTIILMLGVAVCASRVTDHRHHWWDVLTGISIGIASSIYTVNVLCNRFHSRESSCSTDSISETDSMPAGRRLLQNRSGCSTPNIAVP